MTTTAQSIVTRAQAFSALNVPLTSDRSEMLSRIRADQRALFADIADRGREKFQVTTAATTTTGSSARTINIGALTPPVGRLLSVLVAGTPVNQVDVQDQAAQFPPRYVAAGSFLTEVGSDWGASGALGVVIIYVQAPTDIDPAGLYTQTVSVPDEWCDLLVLPLAMYLHQKDPGRDPAEFDRLAAMLAARRAAFDLYLTGYAGEILHAPAHRN